MTKDIVPSVIINPQELAQHPLNSNTHDQAHIESLASGLDTLSQYRNIVFWTCRERLTVENEESGETVVLKPGVKYILAGNGLQQAAMLRGDEAIEVKDRSDLTFNESLLLMEWDNASPLGSKPDPVKMEANLERARGLIADNPKMGEMLERARELAGVVDLDGIEFKEYDESIEDEVEYVTCPHCGEEFPK
jgi:hypothetical protein